MAQCQDFEGEIVTASEDRKRIRQNDPKSGQHNTLSLIPNLRESIISSTDALSATHRTDVERLGWIDDDDVLALLEVLNQSLPVERREHRYGISDKEPEPWQTVALSKQERRIKSLARRAKDRGGAD